MSTEQILSWFKLKWDKDGVIAKIMFGNMPKEDHIKHEQKEKNLGGKKNKQHTMRFPVWF